MFAVLISVCSVPFYKTLTNWHQICLHIHFVRAAVTNLCCLVFILNDCFAFIQYSTMVLNYTKKHGLPSMGISMTRIDPRPSLSLQGIPICFGA
jgi:hypothetical protein